MTVYTIGQVAKICKVPPRTVSKWVDSGRLKGYRIPGSQDRRIPREYLVRFLKEHGMPLGDLEDELVNKVLIGTSDQGISSFFKELLSTDEFKVTKVGNSFEVGHHFGHSCPDFLIMDFSIGRQDVENLCVNIRKFYKPSEIALIVIVPENTHSFENSLVQEVFAMPLDKTDFIERLKKYKKSN